MVKAVGSYIIVSPIKEEVKTSSGMILTASETKEARYAVGSVVSAGDSVSCTKTGDKIYFDSGRSFNMMVEGDVVVIIREADVVLVDS